MTSVFILACGRQGPMLPWKVEATQQKALLEIADGYAVIDFQINSLLHKKLEDIYVVVGWKQNEVKNHCKERGYNVKFVLDPHWKDGAYSSGRTLWEIQDVLWSSSFPIITLYGDVLFSQKTLEDILKCSCDVCCIIDREGNHRQDLVKWSHRGLQFAMNILNDKELRENADGLNNPVWHQIRQHAIKSKKDDTDYLTYNAIRSPSFQNINDDWTYRKAKEWFNIM